MNKILLSDIVKRLILEHNIPLRWSSGINEQGNEIVYSRRMFKDYDHYNWALMWKLDPAIEINNSTGEISIFNCETNDNDIKIWNVADPDAMSEFIKALKIYFPKN